MKHVTVQLPNSQTFCVPSDVELARQVLKCNDSVKADFSLTVG